MVNPTDLISPLSRPSRAPIRVMLVDDSKVVLSVFSRILESDPRIRMAAQMHSISDALAYLDSNKVDVILLDIQMPDRSGLEALPDILNAGNGAKVMIVSSIAEQDGPAAIKALELGACDALAKPGRTGYRGQFAEVLIERVVSLGQSEREKIGAAKKIQTNNNIRTISNPSCIAIGASTGGLPAIYTLIGKLKKSVTCPIFITQHLPEEFMTFFAKQLSAATSRKVIVPMNGDIVENNTVYVAPGDADLGLAKQGDELYIKLLSRRPENIYCPSVDVMLENIASFYGSDALAFICSGMGNDGLKGARELSKVSATIVAQDSESSVVWGMPGSVVRDGISTHILDPIQLVSAINAGLNI
jgi:two-component system, chemotaxis family, protein-glutamate methylesterase/glutaminase